MTDGTGFEPLKLVVWVSLAVYLALVIGFAWNPNPLAQVLAAIGILAAVVHAIRFYGWKDGSALFAICVAITFVMENIGATTGWPFGRYHFEVGADLPHIGAIPVIVGPLWFGMGYFSWHVAAVLLGVPARPSGRFECLALPLVAAFVMTQWDVVMEPAASTIAKAWIWHDGGAHFGVPLSNYAGWLLTTWLFYQAFAVYLSRRVGLAAPPPSQMRTLRLVAIAFYLASALTHLTPWLIGGGGEVTDAAGQLWRISDLRGATVVTMLSTMFVTSMLATLKLANVQGDR
ncbi:MAG TPA: carotenoid biosynthesis protein [Bradyrhizobium sp.]|uniref:carotenoid biosynthesis protein n=1 Tax=Bradyrhizobium sp. TaxID=376 RepID=UPI002D7F0B81|nr:carotenoid biosynthesis protein [Bradyrhizobium sp.]HET7885588.1 carotenoid biosynthesis protein [Bradyrhizobium sp.]